MAMTKAEFDAKWAARDAKRHDEERKRQEHLEAERARRGTPQRFTLTGMQFHRGAHEEDSCWTLPSIDPDLERDETLRVREDSITEGDIEAVASELALIADYDPNELTPEGWATVRDGYRDKAKRLLSMVLGSDDGTHDDD